MKKFEIISKIYTKQSYPHALWIKCGIEAESDQAALDKFYHDVTEKLDFVSAETSAKEIQ